MQCLKFHDSIVMLLLKATMFWIWPVRLKWSTTRADIVALIQSAPLLLSTDYVIQMLTQGCVH